jgi:formate dehydrogenase major subunit
MNANRRDFLKASLGGGAALAFLGFDPAPAFAQLRELKIARATETRATCPYCAANLIGI